MKRVNQYERTDRDITNALLKLMEEKPFEKITVQDILEEALVNRSTFYQHFTDKYAVLERLQEKYVTGMTRRIDEIMASGKLELDQISLAMWEYLSENRDGMTKLISVRSEVLDLEGQMARLFAKYLERSSLNALETDLLSGMTVRFFTHFLTSDMDARNLPETMLNAWLHMSSYFLRVDDVPDAGERLLALVGELHREKP